MNHHLWKRLISKKLAGTYIFVLGYYMVMYKASINKWVLSVKYPGEEREFLDEQADIRYCFDTVDIHNTAVAINS